MVTIIKGLGKIVAEEVKSVCVGERVDRWASIFFLFLFFSFWMYVEGCGGNVL